MTFENLTIGERVHVLAVEDIYSHLLDEEEVDKEDVEVLLYELYDAQSYEEVYGIVNRANTPYEAQVVVEALKEYRKW